MLKFLVVFFCGVLLFGTISAQYKLNLKGTVSGYNYNPKNGLFNKGGEVSLEGSLSGVFLKVNEGNKQITTAKTNSSGVFSLELPMGAVYSLEYSKEGYEKSIIDIDLSKCDDVGQDLTLKTLELVLNSHKQLKVGEEPQAFGEIKYNSSMLSLEFSEYEQEGGILKKKVDYGPAVSLIETSIKKNEPFLFKKNSKPVSSQVEDNSVVLDTNGFSDNNTVVLPERMLSPFMADRIESPDYIKVSTLLNGKDILENEDLIKEARAQLELDKQNASTEMDFLLIEEREATLTALENELKKAKELAKSRENELAQQQKIVWLFVFLFLLGLTAGVYYYISWKKKKQLSEELLEKDRKIQDSINYAERIQQAILPDIKAFSEMVTDSFILFQPKDKVSGDFYWTQEVSGKVIVASVDCTGHGVPGAFMSMIGNTLLNQIILEEKVLSPKEILNQLSTKIKEVLHQDESDPFGNQDGMDMSICVFDKSEGNIVYAGAMNDIYKVSNSKIDVLNVSKRGIGGVENLKGEFEEYKIEVKKGEKFYMMSDGFLDQFGGDIGDKYNIPRFKSLLLKVERSSMSHQKEAFEKAFIDWKGDYEQTDDVLLIGFSIS